MLRRGFTIVELIIVITVMGILLILGVVNLSSSQVSSRDAERKSDIETIAMHLETYYNSGTDGSTTIGEYPSADEINVLANQTKILRDIDPRALSAPGQTGSSLSAQHLFSGIDINKYIYNPISIGGTYCQYEYQECSRYRLYYKLESGTKEIITFTSKNQ